MAGTSLSLLQSSMARIRVRKIVTLFPMSLDVGMTIWLLRKFGAGRYYNIETAELEFWRGAIPPTGTTMQECERNGYLFIGFGGGPHDHHPTSSKPGECTFTLLLRELGLEKDSRFRLLKRIVVGDDTRSLPRKRDAAGVGNGTGGVMETDDHVYAATWARTFKDDLSVF